MANIQQRRSFISHSGSSAIHQQSSLDRPSTSSMLQAVSQAQCFLTDRELHGTAHTDRELHGTALTDSLGKPLKGILKNNQFQSLPRDAANMTDEISNFPRSMLLPLHQSCDTLTRNEVLDTVESSV